jgi:hypothetical protein
MRAAGLSASPARSLAPAGAAAPVPVAALFPAVPADDRIASRRAPRRDRPASAHYHRYHIATAATPDLRPLPHRFLVQVNKLRLARLLLTELFRYWGKWDVVLNRPCIYGVFSGPVGGFSPRAERCVGCLRCTIQHPDVVRILPNPALRQWGDDYCTPRQVETIFYEASKGRVPVKGQGYRGRFGGAGWDGMWTDMSEIVRPTRDGIHGRELISTVVDIGARSSHLQLAEDGSLAAPPPRTFTLQMPLLFDLLPDSLLAAARTGSAGSRLHDLAAIWARAAAELETLAVLPLATLRRCGLAGPQLAPLIGPGEIGDDLAELAADAASAPQMVELAGWEPGAFAALARLLPETVVAVRLPFAAGWRGRLLDAFGAGARTFHLEADYHGRGEAGGFVLDLLIEANRALVEAGVRDQATLLGSGGIVAAEHVPKAIIAGLDAVALDTAALLALQCRPLGRLASRATARVEMPPGMTVGWGTQRLKNLCAAWRDQLLEVMGAMGLREVRRLRGELGRAMFQHDLEAEAFGEIAGWSDPGGHCGERGADD